MPKMTTPDRLAGASSEARRLYAAILRFAPDPPHKILFAVGPNPWNITPGEFQREYLGGCDHTEFLAAARELDRLGAVNWVTQHIGLYHFPCHTVTIFADGESALSPARPEGGTKPDKMSKQSRAVAALAEHHKWSDKQIAAYAGCNVKSLYRMPVFVKAKAIIASGKDDLPRGSKSIDDDGSELQAWDDDAPRLSTDSRLPRG